MPELVLLSVKMSVAYYVMYRVLPLISSRTNAVRVAVEFLLVFALALLVYRFLLWNVVYNLIYQEDGYQTGSFRNEFARSVYRSLEILTVIGLAAIIKLFRTRIQQVQREKQLVEEKLRSELNYLRSQINPHFLFNTLNNIYVLARKKSDEAPVAVMQLSKILRFMLYECSKPKISLADEIQLIEDYTTLEILRYGDRLSYRFTRDVDNMESVLAPLLLLPLVENAFKHGVSDMRENSVIDIHLTVSAGQLTCKVRNTHDNKDYQEGNGIGLINLRRQLELLYAIQTLSIVNNGNEYTATLTIDLNSFRENQMSHY